METLPEHPLDKYLRKGIANPFCPGCGEPIVLFNTLRVLDELDLNPNKVSIVVGIGCSGFFRRIVNLDVASTLHGRAIPFATGLRLANPELTVIVFTGDGDGATIGGNHLIHAARRNIDLTVILLNNGIYGNTGGQVASMTPTGAYTTTSPYGNIEEPFDLCELMVSAGANYVARWTTYHLRPLMGSIKKGITKRGFSFIEVLCQCPVQYGRRNNMPNPIDMVKWFKDRSIRRERAEKMSEDKLRGKIVVGEFIDRKRPEFTTEILNLNKRVRGLRHD